MSTSDQSTFVWAFLPGQREPVVAGGLERSTTLPGFAFQYARSYLTRADAISLGPDLPLDGALAVEDPEGSDRGLSRAVRHALTAAGGSQPKAFVTVESQQWLAKFQTSYDARSPIIKAERAVLHIAARAGIAVPEARLVKIADQPAGRDLALLTTRFDCARADDGDTGGRLQVLSGLTIAEDYRPSGASYPKLLENLRRLSPAPQEAGRELFRRLAFRIAMRVDDDHLRNVAFFWDGEQASITPAFDLSADLVATPSGLTDLGDGTREFSLAALISQHRHYHVPHRDAQAIADEMVQAVVNHRAEAADIGLMTRHEKQLLMTRTATRELIGGPAAVTPGATLRRFPEPASDDAAPPAHDDGPQLG
jgi:serine/threonine-protein kinase HipA